MPKSTTCENWEKRFQDMTTAEKEVFLRRKAKDETLSHT
jgi:hypothetical protein